MSRPSSPTPSSTTLSSSTNPTCSSCPPWPISYSAISHIALNSGISDVSNNPEGNGITGHLWSLHESGLNEKEDFGRGQTPRPSITSQAALFAYYQTGTHGPQFGYRLILAEEGNDVERVVELVDARGPITPITAEMLVFPKDGLEVMVVLQERGGPGGLIDEDDDTDRRAIEFILGSSLLDDQRLDVSTYRPGSLANELRERCCRDQTSLLTLGGDLQKITYTSSDGEGGSGEAQLLLVTGRKNRPERVEEEVLGWVREATVQGVEASTACLVFEEKEGGMSSFR